MGRDIQDRLFDKKFRSEVSKESLKDYKQLKQKDSDSALALLVSYILKFKKKDIKASHVRASEFDQIKHEALNIYNRKRPTKVFSIRNFQITAAASILLIFGVSTYLMGEYHLFSGFNSQNDVIEIATSKGQQSELTLPDGTFVALNYDSKLKYHLANSNALQEVELVGEAFFKVTKNKARTFRVITKDMNVNVLGTEFNVKAYEDDRKTETVLVEGSVEIDHITENKKSVILKPGDKWTFDKINHKHAIIRTDASLTKRWITGEHYFDKITLGELAKTLERMYKVEIRFKDSSLKNEIYSGSVYQDEAIEELFDVIKLTIAINIEKNEDEIWISKK
ncbi:FecR family protein [Sunxiuqinia indica]|uniref:FecR family protein n=1 Tax=Sunxiuqinia indica TaxID=2692584 RepID=UPI0013581882|nr:FecR family protein [Sunxiuqinia indica]